MTKCQKSAALPHHRSHDTVLKLHRYRAMNIVSVPRREYQALVATMIICIIITAVCFVMMCCAMATADQALEIAKGMS